MGCEKPLKNRILQSSNFKPYIGIPKDSEIVPKCVSIIVSELLRILRISKPEMSFRRKNAACTSNI